MDDLNSDPEFDKILAEMLPNSGENIVPVASTSSAIARSPHSDAVYNVFSCNYQWNAGFQTFPQPVITNQNIQIIIDYNIKGSFHSQITFIWVKKYFSRQDTCLASVKIW